MVDRPKIESMCNTDREWQWITPEWKRYFIKVWQRHILKYLNAYIKSFGSKYVQMLQCFLIFCANYISTSILRE